MSREVDAFGGAVGPEAREEAFDAGRFGDADGGVLGGAEEADGGRVVLGNRPRLERRCGRS